MKTIRDVKRDVSKKNIQSSEVNKLLEILFEEYIKGLEDNNE